MTDPFRLFEDDPRPVLDGPLGPRQAPFDSRYGGSTPWERSLNEYVSLGRPNPAARPFEGLGKTNVAAGLPFAPVTRPRRTAEPEPIGAPQPGLFESFGYGLTKFAGEFIPLNVATDIFGSGLGADIEEGAAKLMGAIGSVFDGISDVVPVQNWLPGGGDIEGTYEDLPEDALKRKYDALMRQNPTARLEYMKQYLDQRGSEIARMRGFGGEWAEMAAPSSSFSEQLRRLVFGGMIAAQNQVALGFINNGSMRDVDNSILAKPDEELPAELAALKKRHLTGEIDRREFMEELLLSEYRWTNSDGPEAFFINLVMDIVSDPIIWASFGTGLAAKASGSMAMRAARRGVVKAVEGSSVREQAAQAIGQRLHMSPEAVLKSGDDTVMKEVADWAKGNAPDVYRQGLDSLTPGKRLLYELDPLIQPASKIAHEVDSLFGFFGTTKVARRLGAFRQSKHVEGVARAVGVKRVKQAQNLFGREKFDDFAAYFGIAVANLSAKLAQVKEVEALLAHNRVTDAGPLKDPSITPEQAVRANIPKTMQEGLPREAEQGFLEYMEHAVTEGQVADMRQSMLRPLVNATGKSPDEVRAVLDAADRRQLAFYHFVLYGRQVRLFDTALDDHIASVRSHLDTAQKAGDAAEVERLTDVLAQVERYTLVSENTLTRTDAQTVLAAINSPTDAARRAAIDAVNRYDQLNINFNPAAMDAEALRSAVKQHIEGLLSREGTLIEIVNPSELHPRLANALDTRYRVGLAPDDVWGITRNADGNIIGANPFVPALSDIDVSISRPISWYDRMKEGLMGPISGARIHAENKVRFREVSSKVYNMTRSEADTLFDAINRQAIVRQKGARGFSSHELNDIAKNAGVHLSPEIAARYGERAFLELVLTAYNTDLAMLGVSSFASSRFKSKFGRMPLGDNIVGKIAEDLYPKLRFGLSPIFLAMELVEGPFFAILRGIKPGWRYSRDDVMRMAIVRESINAKALHENGAGIGRAHIAYGDGQIATRVEQASRFTRAWNKLMPESLARNPVRIKGPRWFNVYEWKRVLYYRQAAGRASREWYDAMRREHPDALRKWEDAAGTSDPEKVWMTYMEDRGAFDASARHSIHMFDAAKPSSMGRERVRIGDVSRFQGFGTWAEMREAILAGGLTEDAFMKKYRSAGLNEDYARRAWYYASGFTEGEWEAALRDAVGDADAEGAINFHRWQAKAAGLSIEEFLNEKYGQVAQVVQNGHKVPGVAFRQTLRETLDHAGMEFHDASSPIFRRSKEESKTLLVAAQDISDSLKKKTKRGQEGMYEKGIPPSMPEHMKFLLSDDPKVRVQGFANLYQNFAHVFGDPDQMLAAAGWYDDMTTVFLGLVSKMPQSLIDSLLDSWERRAPAEMRARLAKVSADPDERKAVLAARLNIAFSGSQQRDSVLSGMKKVGNMLNEVFADKDRARLEQDAIRKLQGAKDAKNKALAKEFFDPKTSAARKAEILDYKVDNRYGFDHIGRRMEDIIRDFGTMKAEDLAQKLTDFNDSLAGNLVRSLDPDGRLQPAAMDIWMKRVFGFGDNAYLRYHIDAAMETGRYADEAAAEAAIRKEYGWPEGDLGKGPAPDEYQYEWMLQQTNDFKDFLNGELRDKDGNIIPGQAVIPGPNGEKWTAAAVQAMMWVGEQKRVHYTETPTMATMKLAGAHVGPENLRGIIRSRPSMIELVTQYGDEAIDIFNNVQRDANSAVFPLVSEATGATPLRTLDGLGEGATNVVFANEEQSRAAAMHMAAAVNRPIAIMGKGTTHLTFDISFDPALKPSQTAPYQKALADLLDEYLPDQFTHMQPWVNDDNSVALRAVSKKKLPEQALPPDVVKALEDGTWVHRFDPEAAPLPMLIGDGKVAFEVISPEEGARFVGDESVVNRYRTASEEATGRSYAENATEAVTARERRTEVELQPGDTATQRDPSRPTAGGYNVRAGFKAATQAERAALYFVNNAADATSALHEAFHLFARSLDQSAKDQFRDAFNSAHGLTGRAKKRKFTREVEEWVAEEFEAFAAGDIDPHATYYSAFKSFAEWGKRAGIRRGSAIDDVFTSVLDSWSDVPGGFTNIEERRIWETARISLLRAEEEAHNTAYYRRSPNWMGRSLNHPYLGLYPANYMWGKVLPELTRFLLRRPFGLKAPLGGLAMYNHVHRNFEAQLNLDEGLNQYIEDHPETARFLTIMLPGNPVEMPVNLPLWSRRMVENETENRMRVAAGEEPKDFDTMATLGDTASYAVGYTQLFGRMGDMVGEWMGEDTEPPTGNPFVNPEVIT